MNWNLLPADESIQATLTTALGIPPVVAQLLINRKITDVNYARAFFKPSLNDLQDPNDIVGVTKALERIDKALKDKEKIVIYGDYDTDGITATVLLKNMFKFIGVDVDFYIPHRLEEGYSLNKKAMEKLVADGAKLIITVDCGITGLEEVTYAKKLGLDIIITDHHEPLRDKSGGLILPEAFVIINPKISPGAFKELSGVGVAFKLLWAFTQRLSNDKKRSAKFQKFMAESIALVVVGTITDVVPLSSENRILTAYGVPLLKSLSIPWLDALIETSRIKRNLFSPRDISFRIGPRLNASGRLGTALVAAELLMTDSKERALELAGELEKSNQQRQRIEKKIVESARQKIKEEINLDKEYVIVLADKTWHEGVIGIVASKLADEFHRPVILFALKGERAKGSARSIDSFHLYDALQTCSSLLDSLGGHAYAAGMEIKEENIRILRNDINIYARENLTPEDLVPSIDIDAEVNLDQLSMNTVQLIQQMAPFGEGNREPVLLSRNVRIAGQPRLCGNNDDHCAFVVRDFDSEGKHSVRVIAYWMSERQQELLKLTDKPFQIVYTPEVNFWNNQTEIVLNLKDFKPLEISSFSL
jgi:single-stranded-DNA-specific exonuclease